MSQSLRFEDPNRFSFITVRTQRSQLVFANNPALEEAVLIKLARYQDKYQSELYAFVFEGSHYHLAARFPGTNRALFMRDLDSAAAKAVRFFVPDFIGGKVWERRYKEQELPQATDLEKQFLYCALQVVQDGVCSDIRNSTSYNSFADAVAGVERELKDVDWLAYHNARRFNPTVDINKYTTIRKLKFTRIPGYESLTQKQYADLMWDKLLYLQNEIVAKRRAEGLGFMDDEARAAVKPTDFAKNPKKSDRFSFNPLVITTCPIVRKECLKRYFDLLNSYREASKRYLAGESNVKFPIGTYKPPLFLA